MNFSMTRRQLLQAGLISALLIPPLRRSASSSQLLARGARLN